MRGFSWARCLAVMIKEFMQMKRDPVTIGMLIMIPIIQLLLFGYAINVNPKHLPTVVVSADHSAYTRTFTHALENTDYFKIVKSNVTEEKARLMMKRGTAQFIVNIPPNFTRDLLRGLRPNLAITVDATDSSATGNAVAALQALAQHVFEQELSRGMPQLNPKPAPYNMIIHFKYNPESITAYNIVPGLMGVILTMTLVMITALAITREREIGTMESLLATPLRPLEVMLGKITPYVIVGYVQQIIILLAAVFLFHVPNNGSVMVLLLATLPFILANLMVGLTFSTLADNQLQAMQLTFFFFLPSILLSGFMFPFHGMPDWAQTIGGFLPMTHFTRIVRGIMLKGDGWFVIWPQIWPLLIFIFFAGIVALKRYRQTLDS